MNVQPTRVPLGTAIVNGQAVPVYISREWSKALADNAREIALLQQQLAALTLQVQALI